MDQETTVPEQKVLKKEDILLGPPPIVLKARVYDRLHMFTTEDGEDTIPLNILGIEWKGKDKSERAFIHAFVDTENTEVSEALDLRLCYFVETHTAIILEVC